MVIQTKLIVKYIDICSSQLAYYRTMYAACQSCKPMLFQNQIGAKNYTATALTAFNNHATLV